MVSQPLLARSLLPAIIAVFLLAPVAEAAKRKPVYRDPPGYLGVTKAPPTKPAPVPRPVPLSTKGLGPHLVVDDAGTGHIVWAEGGPDDGLADRVVYCRLKRGARACDVRTTLRAGPESPYNTDYLGPRIVRVGQQLVAFSVRYPVVVDKPGGGSSTTVWAWTSNDGGTSWSQPAVVGDRQLGDMVVTGPGDSPAILNFAHDPFCGLCLQAYRSGQYGGRSASLGVRNGDSYYPQIELDRGLPVVSWVNLDGTTHLRRWTGQGSVLDGATWTAPTALTNADESDLAGGPSGLALASRPRGGARHFELRNISGSGFGSPTRITPAEFQSAQFMTLEQDAAGRMLAAWSETSDFTKRDGLWLRIAGAASGGRPSFQPPQRHVRGIKNGQIDLAATHDGGGFAAFNHTGGVVSHGEIMAAGFGSQAPNGRRGLGDVPGGGASGTTCQKVKFGSFTADTAAGCFLHGTGDSSHLVVTAGEINLHGVRIIPVGGTKIVLDPHALRIDTTGAVRVVVSSPLVGEITLWRGEIHRDLSAVRPGTNLFEFPIGEYATNVLGFDVAANVQVRLAKDGVRIPLALRLPPVFGGFSGRAELISTADRGLVLGSLQIRIGPVPLGPLIVREVDIRYEAATELWRGTGSVTLPAAGTLDAHPVEFERGRFKRAVMSYTPPKPIPIGPFVYLLRIGGGFALDPVSIEASARVGAGAAVAGTAPVNVDGRFLMRFPARGPASFAMEGRLLLFILQVAEGRLTFQSDGYAAFRGQAGTSMGPLEVNAAMNGFVDGTRGTFGADLNGRVALCINVPTLGRQCISAGGESAVSSRGFAACVKTVFPAPVGEVAAGLSFPWTSFDPGMLFNPGYAALKLLSHLHAGCDTAEYRIPPPRPVSARAAQAGAVAFSVPRRLPTASVLVEGEGGPPSVTATGPGGVVVRSAQPGKAGMGFHVEGTPATYLLLRRPRGGTWTLSADPGSHAIKSVRLSQGFKRAKVTAKLGGRGRKRSISYRLSDRGNGQRAVFLERGGFGSRVVGSTDRARGTIRYTPADVRGRRRTVVAQIQHDGFVSQQKRIGAYRAPPLSRPGKPRRVRAVRRGRSVRVAWRAAKGAQRYSVRMRGKRGTSVGRLVGRRARRVSFPRIRRDERLEVTVFAISKKLRSGRIAKKRLKPARR